MNLLGRSLSLLSLAAIGAAGCAAGSTGGTSSLGSGGGGGDATATTSAATTGTGGTATTGAGGEGGSIFTGAGGSGGGTPDKVIVYAHTNKVLYQLDPTVADLGLSIIGNFECIGSAAGQDSAMTDIAVNSQGEIWGISASKIYHLEIQGNVVKCLTQQALNNAQGVQFYALSFAPPGVLDPVKEVLVAGNTAGELYAVDTNGNLTLHGNFGLVPANDGNGHDYPSKNKGKRWELSGDIVFLANNGQPVGFATVRDCPNPPVNSACNPVDTLIEINMAAIKGASSQSITKSVRGQIVQQAGCSDPAGQAGYGSMYGIAAWNDKIFGTSHSGAIVEINNADGTACLVKDAPMTFWNGAGVTTLAPVINPPPK